MKPIDLELKLTRVRFLTHQLAQFTLDLSRQCNLDKHGADAARIARMLVDAGRECHFLVDPGAPQASLRALLQVATDSDAAERLIDLAGEMFDRADNLEQEWQGPLSRRLEILSALDSSLTQSSQALKESTASEMRPWNDWQFLDWLEQKRFSRSDKAARVMGRIADHTFLTRAVANHVSIASKAAALARSLAQAVASDAGNQERSGGPVQFVKMVLCVQF